jgi:hypothetical protein
MEDDALLDLSWKGLRSIAPHLSEEDVIARHVARAPYAQAICTANFLEVLPRQSAPLAGLHLLDSIFLYPEDRTQSGHLRKAHELAAQIGPAT